MARKCLEPTVVCACGDREQDIWLPEAGERGHEARFAHARWSMKTDKSWDMDDKNRFLVPGLRAKAEN